MSADTHILLWYEPQDYKGGFPQTEVDQFNADPELVWLEPLASSDKWTYIGWLDHYPYKLLKETKADQVMLIPEGSYGWREVDKETGYPKPRDT